MRTYKCRYGRFNAEQLSANPVRVAHQGLTGWMGTNSSGNYACTMDPDNILPEQEISGVKVTASTPEMALRELCFMLSEHHQHEDIYLDQDAMARNSARLTEFIESPPEATDTGPG